MDYHGPDREDLANVYALNQAFMEALLRGPHRDGEEARLANELRSLGHLRRTRIANCPFLLFSLTDVYLSERESEAAHGGQQDLLRDREPEIPTHPRLVTAALGFLWQLARRNAYAVRLITGAPLHWCESLAACTLIGLLELGVREPQILSVVRPGDSRFWNKLLVAGTSDNPGVRQAARLSALQTVLTASASEKLQRLPAAACAMPSPVSVRVSRGYNTRPDESAVHKKSKKDL